MNIQIKKIIIFLLILVKQLVGTYIIIINDNKKGQIREKDSYGNDSKKSKG